LGPTCSVVSGKKIILFAADNLSWSLVNIGLNGQ
jgi:hypothetical protein